MHHFFIFFIVAAALTDRCLSFRVFTSSLLRFRYMESLKQMSPRFSHSSPSSSDCLYANSNYEVETKKGEAVLHAGLKECVKRVIKHWKYADEDITVCALRGGITNLLYTLTPMEMEDKTVIVRIYGEGTSLFVDRVTENIVFSSLSDRDIGPKFYGTFQNGRVEGYCDARTLTPEEMKDSILYPKTSMAIARLHSQDISEISHDVSLWTKLDSFFDFASTAMKSSYHNRESSEFKSGDFTLEEMREQSLILRKYMEDSRTKLIHDRSIAMNKPEKMRIDGRIFGYEVVLCHNDLLSGNILLFNNIKDTLPSEAVMKEITQYSVEEKNSGSITPEEHSSSSVCVRNIPQDDGYSHRKESENFSNSFLIDPKSSQKDMNMNMNMNTDGVTLIDFEYAAYNYRAWDIANHFNEFAGFDFNIEKDFPTKDRRIEFLKLYVKGVAESDSSLSQTPFKEIFKNREDLHDFVDGLEVKFKI